MDTLPVWPTGLTAAFIVSSSVGCLLPIGVETSKTLQARLANEVGTLRFAHPTHGVCVIPLKIQRRVVDHFLHDEEGAGLPDARQRQQLLAVQSPEIGDVLDADLEKEIEVAGHQMTIEHERQFAGCGLKG